MSTTIAKSKAHLYSCWTRMGEDGIVAGQRGEFNLPSSKFLNRAAKK